MGDKQGEITESGHHARREVQTEASSAALPASTVPASLYNAALATPGQNVQGDTRQVPLQTEQATLTNNEATNTGLVSSNLSPVGYGGLGMGLMGYGGLGMGYGGLGMGYGGLGMGYGGVGVPEDFQRSQMTFMLVGRLLEMCTMFSGVIQMTFGSVLQFMGSYIGMSQHYNQLKSGMYMDETGKWVSVPKRLTRKSSIYSPRARGLDKGRNHVGSRLILLNAFRYLIFMFIAILLARRITGGCGVRLTS
uniref:Peroxin-13 n=1 Tax=Trypanosoma vivax (strain Y486) TaxID=1055687 RepID=G0U2T0_TRYVY|nr:conserved hypothetical protein [Trypanosoma vivax Y486]